MYVCGRCTYVYSCLYIHVSLCVFVSMHTSVCICVRKPEVDIGCHSGHSPCRQKLPTLSQNSLIWLSLASQIAVDPPNSASWLLGLLVGYHTYLRLDEYSGSELMFLYFLFIQSSSPDQWYHLIIVVFHFHDFLTKFFAVIYYKHPVLVCVWSILP